MNSNINTTGIDADYPKPGEDNSTQGFRNNFQKIKQNFDEAKNNINQLYDNQIKKGDTKTSLHGYVLEDVDLQSVTYFVKPAEGTSTSDVTIDFKNGNYQQFKINANISLMLKWPETENRLSKITVEICKEDQTDTRHIEHIFKEGGGPILTDTEVPSDIEINEGETIVLEFWTPNGGDITFMNFVGTFTNREPQ